MATVTKRSAPNIIFDHDLGDNFSLRIPADAHTLAGFRRWVLSNEFPEKQPVTFLHGDIYLHMPKENIFSHAAVKTAVAGHILGLNQNLDLGDFFINGVLVSNEAADVSNNPDIVGVLWASLDGGMVRYVPNKKNQEMEIEGSPDWIVEIVSDGSVTKDKVDLRNAYHQAGVREYWIIDARGEGIEFQVLAWRKNGYVAASADKDGWRRSRVFDRAFKLTRVKGRRGEWRYTLASKE